MDRQHADMPLLCQLPQGAQQVMLMRQIQCIGWLAQQQVAWLRLRAAVDILRPQLRQHTGELHTCHLTAGQRGDIAFGQRCGAG